jgi:hypothetical protein
MPYETHWEPHGIRWVYTGEVTDEDLIRANQELYEDPRFLAIRYEIADFRNITGAAARSETVTLVGDMDREEAARNPDVKVAILGATPLITGLTRMYAMSGGDAVWDVRIFETEEEARKWIGVGPSGD